MANESSENLGGILVPKIFDRELDPFWILYGTMLLLLLELNIREVS